jgi:hypothetical protein
MSRWTLTSALIGTILSITAMFVSLIICKKEEPGKDDTDMIVDGIPYKSFEIIDKKQKKKWKAVRLGSHGAFAIIPGTEEALP